MDVNSLTGLEVNGEGIDRLKDDGAGVAGVEGNIAGRGVNGKGVTGLNVAGGEGLTIAGGNLNCWQRVIGKGAAGLDVAGGGADGCGGDGKGGIVAGRRFPSFRFGLLRGRGPETSTEA